MDTTTHDERIAAPVLVWDWPVRVFHWLMVGCFAGAWLTAESERWRLVHVSLGYTMAALVVFRLLWGLVGTRHARFASFVRGPAAVRSYLKSLLGRHPEAHAGHNPAGALAVLLLLGLTLGVTASGWATYNEVWGELTEELHEGGANFLMLVVLVHVAGVVVSSLLHHENLVRAMLTGRKQAPAEQAIGRSRPLLAGLLLAGVLGFWAWQWHGTPAPGDALARAPLPHERPHDDDKEHH
jgi:cytochrome b